MYVEYDSNNSGGDWWLSDDDWRALEQAGWKVVWANLRVQCKDGGEHKLDADGLPVLVEDKSTLFLVRDGKEERFLGALATLAFRAGLSLPSAVEEWEEITSQDSTESGCPCCGQPHTFNEYDSDGNYVNSGPEIYYEARWD